MSGSTTRVRERPLVPVLSIGPFTIATHDAFSLLALGVGLVIYYVELRRRGSRGAGCWGRCGSGAYRWG